MTNDLLWHYLARPDLTTVTIAALIFISVSDYHSMPPSQLLAPVTNLIHRPPSVMRHREKGKYFLFYLLNQPRGLVILKFKLI